MAKVLSTASILDHGRQRFVITDGPTDANIATYVKEFQAQGVTTVVRACEPHYSTQPYRDAGFAVHELPFTDGEYPPEHVVDAWLDIVKQELERAAQRNKGEQATIAVHCVAGLGRAPVLVAIALIEAGMEPLDAISVIRSHRRGAINAKQLASLENYKRRSKPQCCVIM
eukprot:TRINITY_DN2450_c0_g1_i1.p1 TRINITY_DN2450_c0_g1~~TRINITY_DN2450_c0_g1_i1.p1  ORF type:complete len:170 (-),score=22.63 TRINITY_DN2450_c0_g1_i1:75-584(-)